MTKKVETQTQIKDGKQIKKTITTVVKPDGTKEVNEVVEEGDYRESESKGKLEQRPCE